MALFHLDKNNKFGLEYPDLEKRKDTFIYVATQLIGDYNGKNNLVVVKYSANKTFHDLTVSNKHAKYKDLFLDKNYHEFLHILNIFFDTIDRKHFDVEILKTGEKLSLILKSVPILLDLKVEIIRYLNSFDLDYFWNENTSQIERKLNEINTMLVNDNLKNINSVFEYSKCVDEFLKPVKDINKNDTLGHLKNVFESVAKSQGLKKPWSGKDKNTLINFLSKGKSPDYLIKQIEFIISSIHHPKDDGTRYQFTDNEYLYWWLEINNFIFILNNQK